MNILVVDDEKEIADLVELFLKNEGFTVYKFYDSKSAVDCIFSKQIDLALLDVMIDETDGFSILRKIREQNLNFPVIMLTAKVEDSDKILGLSLGADDYITKPFGVMELVSRVKAVLRRTQKAEHQQILIYNNIVIDEAQHKVFVDDEEIELTYKEYEVLKLLIINKGIVLTRDKIMESIWGYDFEQGNRTVDVHIQSLRKKVKSAGVHIKTIRNVGYKVGD